VTATTPGILYIAGYSRCGSTVLDIMLGAADGVASGGELTFLGDELADPTRTCGCGEPYAACPVWGSIELPAPPSEVAAVTRAVEGGVLARRGRSAGPEERARYGRIQRALFAHVARRSDARWVVDSSKTARAARGRPVALSVEAGMDVRVVHLVRDAAATAASYRTTGSNWAAEGRGRTARFPVARAMAGWRRANGVAGALREEWPGRYLELRFEEVVADPRPALTAISELCGHDVTAAADLLDDGRAVDPGHLVGGNRLRRAGPLRLAPPAGPPPLRWDDRAAVALLARPAPGRARASG